MKELTIEEKAKRYDEAIKKAEQLYKAAEPMSGCNVILETIFPELKESEDERIRKKICKLLWDNAPYEEAQKYINYICRKQASTNSREYEEMKETCIFYLNKQKCYVNDTSCIKKCIAWLEKQGEKEVSEPKWCHHKVDLSDCSEEYRKAYYDGWNNCNMQHSQCRSELDDVIKCLINGMKFYCEDNEEATWGTDKWSMPVKHIIEVLERHSEQKPYGQRKECSDCQFNYAGECKGSCAMKRDEQKYDNVEPKFKVKYANSEYNVLEIKEIAGVTYYGIEDEPNHIDYVLPDNCEIISEHKSIDKDEPKFHKGDWIVFNGLILHIDEVVNGYYRTTSIGYGIHNSYDWNIDNVARLWTIQEAKDGDVLCYETELRIFIYKNGHVHYHCCYYNGHLTTVDSFFVVEKYLLCYIHPATKEQRDYLFQKIKEAGYEWDAEKKELNKITEHKTDKVTIKLYKK